MAMQSVELDRDCLFKKMRSKSTDNKVRPRRGGCRPTRRSAHAPSAAQRAGTGLRIAAKEGYLHWRAMGAGAGERHAILVRVRNGLMSRRAAAGLESSHAWHDRPLVHPRRHAMHPDALHTTQTSHE